jgi:hypothetical protein
MLRSENASSLLPFSAGGDAVTCENYESQQTICFSFSFSFTGLFFFIFFFVLDLFLSTDLFFSFSFPFFPVSGGGKTRGTAGC